MHTLASMALGLVKEYVASHAHTWRFEPEKAGDLALAVFLLLVGQQLIDKLPDHLLGGSIQDREDVHNQSVNIPFGRKAEEITWLAFKKIMGVANVELI